MPATPCPAARRSGLCQVGVSATVPGEAPPRRTHGGGRDPVSLPLSPTPTLREASERLLDVCRVWGQGWWGAGSQGAGRGGGGGLAGDVRPRAEKGRKSKRSFAGHLHISQGPGVSPAIFPPEPRNGSAASRSRPQTTNKGTEAEKSLTPGISLVRGRAETPTQPQVRSILNSISSSLP